MAPTVTGPELQRLIDLLAKLPGLGPRSARRAALQLIKKRDALMLPLADAISGSGGAHRALFRVRQSWMSSTRVRSVPIRAGIRRSSASLRM